MSGKEQRAAEGLYRRPPTPSRATIKARRAGRFSGRRDSVGRDRKVRHAHAFLEANAYEVLLARADVVDVVEQPAAIVYRDQDGARRMHTFDAVVRLRDGTRIAVVIKPSKVAAERQTQRLVDLLALHLPADVGDYVLLVTELDVDPDALHDARLVGKALLHPRPAHDETLRNHLRLYPEPATVAALCAATGLGGDGYRAVARLVGEGTLTRLSPGRIGLAAVVGLVSQPEEASA